VTEEPSEGGAEFALFYGLRRDAVFRAVLAVGGDRCTAEDAVAEAFARAWSRWARVGRHPNPTAWVILTALNVRRSWWRRLRRELLGTPPERSAPTGGADLTPLSAEIRAAIMALPRRQREVVALRILAQLTAEETGEALGIAPATVHVHLHRAFAALRTHLAATHVDGTNPAGGADVAAPREETLTWPRP
jgi:RNA polymerase sigma factor (sigma-70 family)